MGENYIMEEYKQKLPAIFRQILLLFKDAPTCNSWVSEKLMEVFCKDIAHNLELVKAVDFKSFLDGFLEADGHMIMYPDFVMNNASLMAAEVLSIHNDCSFLEKAAFSVIRSPLQYWMVSRGHRVDVTFQIYKRWIQQRSRLHLLQAVQFDVSQALDYCLASPHNYTRQSAGDYFIELLKLSHNEPQDEAESEVMSNIKSTLKPAIHQLIQEFNSQFTKLAEVTQDVSNSVGRFIPHEKLPDNIRAAANYCRLLSQCAATSDVFCRNCAEAEMFDELVALLETLAFDKHVDTTDLLRPSTVMLIRLINYSNMQEFKVERLIKFVLHLCESDNCLMMCDAIYMARLLLTQCDVQAKDQTLLLELSLLPLFIIFDVTPQLVLSTCPAAITLTKSLFKERQTSKSSNLLKVAVDNLSSLADLQISNTGYNSFIEHLELKVTDLPCEVGLPMLNEGNIRNDILLSFLVLQLTNINLKYKKLTDEKLSLKSKQVYSQLSNIQTYTLACIKFPGISCGQLSAVLNCYLTILKYGKNAEQSKNSDHSETSKDMEFCCNKQVLQDILQRLQFKMFDRDPNVREMAVKITGDLFFIVSQGNPALEASVDMQSSLSSLWQCVDNKTEGVATNVLQFLLNAAEVGQLDTLLSVMSVTKADLITRIDTFLLSREWDDIKPVAFNLLTKVCPMDLLVKYAEACLCQDNVRLSLVVLDYIQHIFSLDKSDDSLEHKIDAVSSLFLQGWGDLILQKANASDVCSFRKASSIITMILCFLDRQDVCSIIDKRVSDFCSNIVMAKGNYGRSHEQFLHVCDKILLAYGCSETTSTKCKRHRLSDEQDSENVELDDKKITLDSTHRFDSSAREKCRHSFLCSLFTLVDVRKVPSGERDITPNRDMLENQQTGDGLAESAQDKMLSSDEFDFYLDSTKEMPALTLRTETFTSQKQIREILPHTDVHSDFSSASGLLSWFVFQATFRRIDPASLLQEAQRSTDEYERNSLTLLFDLEQVLKRSYLSLKDQLEKELIEHLFSSFSCLLNTVLTETDFKKYEFLKEIVKHVQIITLLQHEEEDILTFLLQNRKSILKAPFENDEKINVLDLFLERMNILRVQGSKVYVRELFASGNELKALLQLYIEGKKTYDSFKKFHNSSASVTNYIEVQDLSISTHNIAEVLNKECSNIIQSDILECLSSLKADELCFLNGVFDGESENWEIIQAHLKTLLNSLNQKMFLPVMQALQSLSKQLVLVVLEGSSQTRVERCANVSAGFSQLESWYVAEDCEFDSDGDDDPTAVDCY
ncbi:hypothetical protein BsWGS_05772 [Bradybaena similaris]